MGLHEAHKRLYSLFFVRVVEYTKVGGAVAFRVDVDDLFKLVFGDVIQDVEDEVAVRVYHGHTHIVPDCLDDDVAEKCGFAGAGFS